MNSMWIYLCICLGVFALGDALGVATKARLSSVFVALMIFLVGFMTGIFPADIIDQAGLTQIAKWASTFLIFHMGTSINLRQLVQEWRTVAMSIVAMAVAMVSIFVVVPIIGKEAAFVAIPIINGGIIATQMMTEAAMEQGLALAAALGTFLYAVQKFVGTPPASFFGLKEAERVLAEYRADPVAYKLKVGEAKMGKGGELKPAPFKKYEKYFTDYVCLGVVAVGALLAQVLASATPINYSIWALLLGATAGHLGIVPPAILAKGKASGLLSMATFAIIIPSMAKISFSDLGALGFQTVVVFVAVMVGTVLLLRVLPLWKICGSKDLAVGIAMAQMLGFPATFLIANEVATAATDNEEEKQVVLDRISTAYVVAGMASVTSLSIIIAGIFVPLL